jgi:hypothetical protein
LLVVLGIVGGMAVTVVATRIVRARERRRALANAAHVLPPPPDTPTPIELRPLPTVAPSGPVQAVAMPPAPPPLNVIDAAVPRHAHAATTTAPLLGAPTRNSNGFVSGHPPAHSNGVAREDAGSASRPGVPNGPQGTYDPAEP